MRIISFKTIYCLVKSFGGDWNKVPSPASSSDSATVSSSPGRKKVPPPPPVRKYYPYSGNVCCTYSKRSVFACDKRRWKSRIIITASWLSEDKTIGCLVSSGNDACWIRPSTRSIPKSSMNGVNVARLDTAGTGLYLRKKRMSMAKWCSWSTRVNRMRESRSSGAVSHLALGMGSLALKRA